MNNISWNKIDIVVIELDTGIANPFSSHLIQLRFIHPTDALKQQMQSLDHLLAHVTYGLFLTEAIPNAPSKIWKRLVGHGQKNKRRAHRMRFIAKTTIIYDKSLIFSPTNVRSPFNQRRWQLTVFLFAVLESLFETLLKGDAKKLRKKFDICHCNFKQKLQFH